MNGTLLFRKRLARPIATGLSVVLLALSAAAGFHQGDHDDLGWVPEKFHKHDFRWAEEADGAKAPLIDHCLACQVGRMLVRLAPPAPSLPDAPAPVFAGAARPAAEAPTRSDFLSAPRAPPAS
ncbi:MAG TPA: hypothetical protein VFH82_09850 [Gemmatimonadota bacterium]|jgi:hypothetical protein|nr:hypothetical protein [Gemmatimonadota bacterium]